jgi:hypothetical protein
MCADRCLPDPVLVDAGLWRRTWVRSLRPGGSKVINIPPSERRQGGREGLPEQWWLLVGHVQNIHGGGITGYC